MRTRITPSREANHNSTPDVKRVSGLSNLTEAGKECGECGMPWVAFGRYVHDPRCPFCGSHDTRLRYLTPPPLRRFVLAVRRAA